MNVFAKVALQTLRKNRARTWVTIVGVALSAAMIAAVATLSTSLLFYMQDVAIYSDGDWHISLYGLPAGELDALRADERVARAAMLEDVGYARIENPVWPDRPYLFVAGYQKALSKMMPARLIAGRMPENTAEIALPKSLLSSGSYNWTVGDEISLDLGERTAFGQRLLQDTPADEDIPEDWRFRETRAYTVTGVYEGPLDGYAPGFCLLTAAGESPRADATGQAYLQLKDPMQAYSFRYGDWAAITNGFLLRYQGVTTNDTFYTVLFGLGSVLIALIALGSIALIYNAFSISIAQRVKQFALLSSVGATRRQLRRSVRAEALMISAVGIPLGIAGGVGGIGLTLFLIRDQLASTLGSPDVPMRLRTAPWALLTAAALALITVLVSAYLPSRRIRRISPIDAIRQPDAPGRSGRARAKLRPGILGLTGALAARSYRYHHRRYVSIVLSLAMSIVLFVGAASLVGQVKASLNVAFAAQESDLYLTVYNHALDGEAEQLYAQLRSMPGVQRGARFAYVVVKTTVPAEALAADEAGRLQAGAEWRADGYALPLKLCALPDDAFAQFLLERGLDEDMLSGAQPQAVCYNRQRYYDAGEGRYRDGRLLEKSEGLELALADYEARGHGTTVRIAYEVDALPMGVDFVDNGALVLLMPMSGFEALNAELRENVETVMAFDADDHAAVNRAFNERLLLEGDQDYQTGLWDAAETNERDRGTVTVASVFCYGFIALIALIAAANVTNTVYTNLALRRREFAMLRSVGMKQKELSRMMRLEGGRYALEALLLGAPPSLAASFLIWYTLRAGADISFAPPWAALLAAALGALLVVLVTMSVAMRQIRRDDIAQALKCENF